MRSGTDDVRFYRAEAFSDGRHDRCRVAGWVAYASDRIQTLVPISQGAHCDWPRRPPAEAARRRAALS